MQTAIPFPKECTKIPNKRPGGQPAPRNIGVTIKLSDLPMKDRELAEAVAEAFATHGFSLIEKIRNL
ncbi:hypothetical protein CLV58_1066 [Spirosoma oryzae]|uniref:Uncharacterized protein n=1 Tax=Spirosoma oryzae TaxID=1469603 RepID=A0A2T0T5B2_9BACT|nr:hypothetical protein [Spirosoma oryzae]PRY40823.1 hypothetical protein CLV58_1066 [Spirosoma oryzae]